MQNNKNCLIKVIVKLTKTAIRIDLDKINNLI